MDSLRRYIPKKVEEEVDHPSEWLEEDLDNDGLDLDEWAFSMGYYGEL